ncbi:MAG TPA: DNA polymerase III subunit delta' C-terminal domain-containing protein, partial [Pyrinomonadaceae bacterium]
LARAARGSMGRALATDIESYRARREAMLAVLQALALTPDRVRLLRASEELNDPKRKDDYEQSLDVLETLVRDVWATRLGGRGGQVVNEDLRSQLTKIGERVESARAAGWLLRIEGLRGQLAFNVNRKVAADALLLGMAGA